MDERAHGTQVEVVGISGSLRKRSYNRVLLHAAMELAPEDMHVSEYRIAGLPLYNSDVEGAGDPPEVGRLKRAIREADGVLFVTPEYNYGTTGAMKNAIDWAARGPRGARTSALAGKPVFIMGASVALAGSTRAQQQVREAMVEPGAAVMLQPQVLVARAHERFDADGRLVDESTREFLATAMRDFADWIRRVGRERAAA